MKVKVSQSFRKEVTNVVLRWRKLAQESGGSAKRTTSQKYATQCLDAEHMEGYILERCLLFITESEFLKEHGVAMRDIPQLKSHIQELTENGKPIRGIAVRDPSQPHRRLRIYGAFQSLLTERLHDSAQQLRESQGQEALIAFVRHA